MTNGKSREASKMIANSEPKVHREIQRLAQEAAQRQPCCEAIWLLVSKDKQLRAYITSPDVYRVEGMLGYCVVAVADNICNPHPNDIVREWAYDIVGDDEELSTKDALNIIEREIDYIANMLAS
jgi:hypothetical protein